MSELNSNVPDFGWVDEVYDAGSGLTVTLTCKAVVPGLSITDLVHIYTHAAKTGKPWSFEPADWAETKGIEAVVAAVLNAIYSDKNTSNSKSNTV